MGWSQVALADKAGVDDSKIARVESGKRALKTGFLHQLARIFGVPASAILEINPATNEGAQTAELLVAWGDLNPNQRDDILKQVRAIGRRSDAG